MVMLSHLRRFNITDGRDQTRLIDLSVALFEGDYPPVTRLYFLNAKKKRHSLSWDDVESVDWANRLIRVGDLEKAQGESTDSMAKQVLLHDGILDALILDLQNRRATRANDLCLKEENGKLLLCSADTSVRRDSAALNWRTLWSCVRGRTLRLEVCGVSARRS